MSVAADEAGQFFVASDNNYRVRRVTSEGIISTIAGNGELGFSGDGGPAAEASLALPRGLAVDAVGNLFITDFGNCRIRRVTAVGTISTVAGSGCGTNLTNEGDLATETGIYALDVAVDQVGNLFIGDGKRIIAAKDKALIRRVTPDGRISTAAGPFDGNPSGVAVDAFGSLLVLERGETSGIRRVDSEGRMSTLVEIPRSNLTSTSRYPPGIAVDGLGNVFFPEWNRDRIRRVTPDGAVATIAGNGQRGFSGDAGLAINASLSQPADVAVDSAGNLYIADFGNQRIRKVSFERTSLLVIPSQLSVNQRAGAFSPEREIEVASSIPGISLSARVIQGVLSLSVSDGRTPASIKVTFPADQPAGVYESLIEITAPLAEPPVVQIPVTLTVEEANPPLLDVTPLEVSLTAAQNIGPQTSLQVRNAGGGRLDYQAVADAPWIQVGGAEGSVTPTSPSRLDVTASAADLAPGVYEGTVSVFSPTTGETKQTRVTLNVPAQAEPKLLLSRTGMTFRAVEGFENNIPQEIGVLNVGAGSLAWSARALTSSGPTGWLRVTPDSGSSEADSLAVPRVQVRVDVTGLAAGEYGGQVVVEGPNGVSEAANVKLVVLRQGEFLGPIVQPTGVIFSTLEGARRARRTCGSTTWIGSRRSPGSRPRSPKAETGSSMGRKQAPLARWAATPGSSGCSLGLQS